MFWPNIAGLKCHIPKIPTFDTKADFIDTRAIVGS
jgi:hypothetical protein